MSTSSFLDLWRRSPLAQVWFLNFAVADAAGTACMRPMSADPDIRTAPSPLQQQAQLERVGRSCALLVVVEIDKDITPLPFPRAYSVAPLSQRLSTVVTFIAATGT